MRTARAQDLARVLTLWERLSDEIDPSTDAGWVANARDWFVRNVDDRAKARILVVEHGCYLVAVAVATVEDGVPNSHSPCGIAVRVSEVFIEPGHRRLGYATRLVRHLVTWARDEVGADRVDLSATTDGLRVYERLGFVPASAPRMKLPLATPAPRLPDEQERPASP